MPVVANTNPTVKLLDSLHSEDDFWLTNFGVAPIDPTRRSSFEYNTKKRRPRTKKVCIDLGRGIGKHTFSVPYRKFRWMRRARNGVDGATKGECDRNEVRRLRTRLKREHTFCWHFRREAIEVRAPTAAREWLKRRGATEGECDESEIVGDDIHLELIE